MRFQYLLHEEYHSDRRLTDLPLNEFNIPYIKELVKDIVPRNAHQLINRVPTRSSTRQ